MTRRGDLRVFCSGELNLRTNGGLESGLVPYVRTVKTKSGATAVQVVYSSRRGSREIEHLGSAHDEAELEALKAAARQSSAGGCARQASPASPARSASCAFPARPAT
jgi:hypothetical protein